MEFLSLLLNSEVEDIDKIVKERIEILDRQATEEEKERGEENIKLGYDNTTKANSIYNGFIPLKKRVRYDNNALESYSMKTTDFFYEFSQIVVKNNINSMFKVLINIRKYLDKYFGNKNSCSREDIFFLKHLQNTKTDDEFFKSLENNEIGDLKGKNAAECIERTVLAQQLLSLFGFTSYCCTGSTKLADMEKGEFHAYNIIKRKNDYILVDYSIPTKVVNENDEIVMILPFIGEFTNEEFEKFINDEEIKIFDEYYFNVEREKKIVGKKRYYRFGNQIIKDEHENAKYDENDEYDAR